MDKMFVQKPQEVPGALQHPKHKIAQVLDAEDPSRYDFDILQDNIQGTRVPLTTDHGGIMKSDNPFGQVVQGQEIKYLPGDRQVTKEYAPTWLQNKPAEVFPMAAVPDQDAVPLAPEPEVQPDAEAEARADAAVETQRQQVQMEALEGAKKQRLAEDELKRIMVSAGVLTPEKTNTVDKVQPNRETVRVKMSGAFGTYKGHCFAYQVEDNMIVLLYDKDTETFSPPSSPTPFRLSCDKENFDVYFVGIEFELPVFNCSVQVMIRSG